MAVYWYYVFVKSPIFYFSTPKKFSPSPVTADQLAADLQRNIALLMMVQ